MADTDRHDPYSELETSVRERFFELPEAGAWEGGPWDVFDLNAYAERGPVPQLLHTMLLDAHQKNADALRIFLEPLRVDIRIDSVWREAVRPPQKLWWLFEMILKILADIPEGRIEVDCAGLFSVSLGPDIGQTYRAHFLNIVAPATIVLIPQEDPEAVVEVTELMGRVSQESTEENRGELLQELRELVTSHYGETAPELENVYRHIAFDAERAGSAEAEDWHERADAVRDVYVTD